MYGADDPRSKLAGAADASNAPYTDAKPALRFAAAEYVKFHDTVAAEESQSARTWYARGQNFVVAYTEAKPGAVLTRAEQVDEYVVLLPEHGLNVTIATA